MENNELKNQLCDLITKDERKAFEIIEEYRQKREEDRANFNELIKIVEKIALSDDGNTINRYKQFLDEEIEEVNILIKAINNESIKNVLEVAFDLDNNLYERITMIKGDKHKEPIYLKKKALLEGIYNTFANMEESKDTVEQTKAE